MYDPKNKIKRCQNCGFFVRRISDIQRYGWCLKKERVVFTRYGCVEDFVSRYVRTNKQ